MSSQFTAVKPCHQINTVKHAGVGEALVVVEITREVIDEGGSVLVPAATREAILTHDQFEELRNGNFDIKSFKPPHLEHGVHPCFMTERGKARMLEEGNFFMYSKLMESLIKDGDLYLFYNKGGAINFAETKKLDENDVIYANLSSHAIYDFKGYPLRRAVQFRDISSELYDLDKVVEILSQRDDVTFIPAPYGKSPIHSAPNYNGDDREEYRLSFTWKPNEKDWDTIVKTLEGKKDARVEGMFNVLTILGDIDFFNLSEARTPDEDHSPSI